MSRSKLVCIAQLIALSAVFIVENDAYGQIVPVSRHLNEAIRQRVTESVPEQLSERVQQSVSEPLINGKVDLTTLDLSAALIQVQRDANGLIPITNQRGEWVFNERQLADGTRLIEHEWLLHIDAADWEQMQVVLQGMNAEVKTAEHLPALGMTIIRFNLPTDLSATQLREQLTSPELPVNALVPHYIYNAQTAGISDQPLSQAMLAQQTWCEAPVKVGMVDTLIDETHAGLADSQLMQRQFVTDNVKQPLAHGTAVAGLLVAQQQPFKSLVPKAKLYNGAVFYRQGDLHQGAALLPLLQALNWLAEQQVRVINLSLTGPANTLLHEAVQRLAKRDILLIAAAGNDGPLAHAAYPAAYDEVVAVSAVDKHQQIYRWANQGAYIELSALGVRVMTTRRGGHVGVETGTSMAAPVVSAAAACQWATSPHLTAADIRRQLHSIAQDLGETDRDHQYGYGLVHPKN